MKNITVSILCGGKSSRMESEKGLVLWHNKPFIEHIIKAVLPISTAIQLITNGEEYNYLPYVKIKDTIADKGPLGGIYTALEHSKTELNLILSCDIPLISTEILLEIIQKHTAGIDITILADEHKIHPLIGLYSKNMLPIIEQSIKVNDLKMMHLLNRVSHTIHTIANKKSNQLQNINTKVQLYELNNNES
jgi:molybdenum cofactor guanylyltransferase